jgi:hypothetical protein
MRLFRPASTSYSGVSVSAVWGRHFRGTVLLVCERGEGERMKSPDRRQIIGRCRPQHDVG